VVSHRCGCEYVLFDVLIGERLSGRLGTCKVLEDLVAHVDRVGLAGLAMLASLMRRLLSPYRRSLD
jgi:hypothetical protein